MQHACKDADSEERCCASALAELAMIGTFNEKISYDFRRLSSEPASESGGRDRHLAALVEVVGSTRHALCGRKCIEQLHVGGEVPAPNNSIGIVRIDASICEELEMVML